MNSARHRFVILNPGLSPGQAYFRIFLFKMKMLKQAMALSEANVFSKTEMR
ncbi:MAG: hypothetical protein WC650_04315 [Candidatus Doudnabacteria bacterium]